MSIRVHPDYFNTPSQAFGEIAAHRLFPIEMTVPPVRNQSHWHDFSTWIYIVEGELTITDSVRRQSFAAGPGALVEVPKRILHSELSVLGYRIIAGMSKDPAELTGPVDLDPSLL